MRLDLYLAGKQLAESRTKALDTIKKGNVKVNSKIVTKPSFDVGENDTVELCEEKYRYVSRAAEKLVFAKEEFGIDFDGLVGVDLGASTGGFCQVMLEGNIKELFAVDIGHGQLHKEVAKDNRVRVLEGVNARYIDESHIGKKADIVTADLSFISQTLVFEAITRILKPGGIYIGLIKPQFEAGRENIGKHGIVKYKKVHVDVIEKVVCSANLFGLVNKGLAVSPILGGDGNKEFLAYYVFEGISGETPSKEKITRLVTNDG